MSQITFYSTQFLLDSFETNVPLVFVLRRPILLNDVDWEVDDVTRKLVKVQAVMQNIFPGLCTSSPAKQTTK